MWRTVHTTSDLETQIQAQTDTETCCRETESLVEPEPGALWLLLVSLTTTCTPPFASPRHQVASEECSVLRPVSFPHHGKINEKGKGENMFWVWGLVGLLLVRSGSGVAFFRVEKWVLLLVLNKRTVTLFVLFSSSQK